MRKTLLIVLFTTIIAAVRIRDDLVNNFPLKVRQEQFGNAASGQQKEGYDQEREFRLGNLEGPAKIGRIVHGGLDAHTPVTSQNIFSNGGRVGSLAAGDTQIKIAQCATVTSRNSIVVVAAAAVAVLDALTAQIASVQCECAGGFEEDGMPVHRRRKEEALFSRQLGQKDPEQVRAGVHPEHRQAHENREEWGC